MGGMTKANTDSEQESLPLKYYMVTVCAALNNENMLSYGVFQTIKGID